MFILQIQLALSEDASIKIRFHQLMFTFALAVLLPPVPGLEPMSGKDLPRALDRLRYVRIQELQTGH